VILVDNINVYSGTLETDDPSTIDDLEVTGFDPLRGNFASGVATLLADSTINTLHVDLQGEADVIGSPRIDDFRVDAGGLADITGNAVVTTFTVNGTAIDEAEAIFTTLADNGTTTITGTAHCAVADLNLGGTLNVESGGLIGDDTTLLTVASSTTGTANVAAGGYLHFETSDISGTLNLNLTSTATVDVNELTASGAVNISGGQLMTVQTVDVSGTVNVHSNAKVVIANSSEIGTLDVTTGATVTLTARTGSYATSPARVLTVTTLFLGNTNGFATGTLDIKDNDMIVKDGDIGSWDGDEYTGLQGILQHSLHNGAWDLPGIITSISTSSPFTSIGIATASEVLGIGSTATDNWVQGAGLTVGVTGSDILLKYTYTGDANLDGVIASDDYFQIDSHVGLNGSAFDYFNGDFNLDGNIDGDDYFFINSNIGGQGDQL